MNIFIISISTVMEGLGETISANDTEIYLLILETEDYWNISRLIFATLIIFVIFSSLSLVMIITLFIISSFLEKAENVEIFKKVSMATLKKGLLKKFVFGHLVVDIKEEDTLKDTSSSCREIIEWKEEKRLTIVDELEWRGLKSQQQSIGKEDPSCLLLLPGRVRFFLVEEDVEEVKTSIEDNVEEGKMM